MGEINISRQGQGSFKVILGAVTFDVGATRQPDGSVDLNLPEAVRVAPEAQDELIRRITELMRFDK